MNLNYRHLLAGLIALLWLSGSTHRGLARDSGHPFVPRIFERGPVGSADTVSRPVKHVVLVWLKEPGDREARRKLIETSKSFREIPGVIQVEAGTPLESDRPVVDDSFDVAVIITFENREAMLHYESHPRHTRAVEEVLRPLTERMVIYDFKDWENPQ